MIFNAKEFDHELVVFGYDKKTGLHAIIAIHSTKLGPALGGCRMWPYETEAHALEDVLRLSKGMTYKAALADLKLGGGKAVIIGDSHTQKSPALFNAMGEFVHKLGGQYITAEDVGTSFKDMDYIRQKTPYVVGLANNEGGSGDPAPFTALGVLKGLQACVEERFGSADLTDKKVIVQGLGNVGMNLCNYLHDLGAELFVYDIHEDRIDAMAKKYKAKAIKENEIFDMKADVYAPCALGAVLNEETIPRLKTKIVAGAANNQLRKASDGELLLKHGILYAPDFVLNSGGLINVSYEGPLYNRDDALKHLDIIPSTLKEIFQISESENTPTSKAAELLAEERLKKAK